MALEAVVGEDAPQVRMAVEQNAEQIVGLALAPVGAPEKPGPPEGTGVASSVATLTRTRRFSLGESN